MSSTHMPITPSVDETITHLEQQFVTPTEVTDHGPRRGRAVWVEDRAAVVAPVDGIRLANARSRWHPSIPGMRLPGRTR